MAQEFEFRLRQLDSETPIEMTLPQGRTTVGRQPGSDLRLTSDRVSRDHAVLICSRTECRIVDSGSSNKTRVNGEELIPNVPKLLTHNAIIDFAGERFVFEQIVIGMEMPQPAEGNEPTAPSLPDSWEPPRPEVNGDQPYVPPPGLSLYGYRLLQYLPDIYQPGMSYNPFAENGNLDPGSGGGGGGNGYTTHVSSNGKAEDPQLAKRLRMAPADDFMARLLGLFESILMPLAWTIDNFDLFLHADTAPRNFLPWLASWFGITFDSTWSEEQRRTLLREAHTLYARRGTRGTLSRILEIYLGEKPEILEFVEGKSPFYFEVKVSERHRKRQKLIEAIINSHKPANTFYTLEFY